MTAWEATALASLMATAEVEAFHRDGFVMLRAVLTGEEIETLTRRADAELAAARAGGAGPHALLNLHDLVGRAPAFDALVANPRVLPGVWAVLGWNIQLHHTQLVVTPPAPPGALPGGYGWHQDNNRMNLDLETDLDRRSSPQPRLSLKVGYLLSDLPRPGMGNLCVVPGSQQWGRPAVPLGEQPDGVVEVCGSAGDAILFDRRLWHAASTNVSDQTRRMLFYGYSHRWLRPKCRIGPELVPTATPVERQLLGWATSANGRYEPDDEDVPLRVWLAERGLI